MRFVRYLSGVGEYIVIYVSLKNEGKCVVLGVKYLRVFRL